MPILTLIRGGTVIYTETEPHRSRGRGRGRGRSTREPQSFGYPLIIVLWSTLVYTRTQPHPAGGRGNGRHPAPRARGGARPSRPLWKTRTSTRRNEAKKPAIRVFLDHLPDGGGGAAHGCKKRPRLEKAAG